MIETLIAALAVIVMLSIASPMIIRSARIWKQTRHHQFACDELSGQMDRLIAMSPENRAAALADLNVSPETEAVLYEAELTGRLEEDDADGAKIVLSINWRRIGDPPPIRLVGWINPISDSDQSANTAEVPQ